MKVLFLLGYILYHSPGVSVEGTLPFENYNDCITVLEELEKLSAWGATKVELTVTRRCE